MGKPPPWIKSLQNPRNFQLVFVTIAVILGLTALSWHLDYSLFSLFKFDFATTVTPGWHSTIFPPYYILTDLFSTAISVQLVLILSIWLLKIKNVISSKVIEIINIILIVSSFIIGFVHLSEMFITWYSGYFYEQMAFFRQFYGIYWWVYSIISTLNLALPFLFLWKRIRKNLLFTFIICIYLTAHVFFENWILQTH